MMTGVYKNQAGRVLTFYQLLWPLYFVVWLLFMPSGVVHAWTDGATPSSRYSFLPFILFIVSHPEDSPDNTRERVADHSVQAASLREGLESVMDFDSKKEVSEHFREYAPVPPGGQQPVYLFMVELGTTLNDGGVDGDSYTQAVATGYLYLQNIQSSSGNPGEPDRDPSGSRAVTGDDGLDGDEELPGFDLLKKKMSSIRFYNTFGRLKQIHRMLVYINKHPESAVEGYGIALKALKLESAATTAAIVGVMSFIVGFSAFNDVGLAAARSGLTVSHVMLTTIVPLVLSEKWWLDQITVWLGIAARTVGDNGFALEADSPYAMEWDSREYYDFTARLVLSQWFNVLLLKYIYGRLLIPPLARQTFVNKKVLLAVDCPLRLVLLMGTGMLQLAGYPYISLTAGPSPYGPGGKFPLPYYCPKIQWIPWFMGCTTMMPQNSTL